jgi:2-polyprenyl-3-methyl-5-hydroxy-6-metoxy-1,4-benzoquinol methylase
MGDAIPTPAAGASQTCPNCPGAPARAVFADPGGRVLRCLSCGLEFAERYPDIAMAESAIYPAGYFERALAGEDRRAAIYERLIAGIERRLGRTGRLLDVGAGDGQLVRAAMRRGWRAEGTEVSSAAVEHMRGRGLAVRHGELESLALPRAAFDAVVLNHVLEHVRDPVSTLAAVRALLAPGGLVRVEVPNLASLSSRVKNVQSRLGLKRHSWKHYSTGHHFWFFTPRTLARTLATAGLAVDELTAPAEQWDARGPADALANALYGLTKWGGHLVASARAEGAR